MNYGGGGISFLVKKFSRIKIFKVILMEYLRKY